MMINPVSDKQVKSIPAAVPAVSTPLKKVTFRGEPEEDTVEIKGEAAEEKKQISADDIKKKSEEFTSSMEAVADGIDGAANSATQSATKITGAFTLIGGALSKLVPAPIKDFFATPVVKQIQDESGKLVDMLDEEGHKVFETIKSSDGVERVVRKFNAKHTAIAAAALAGIAITIGVVKHFQNKAKKAAKAQKA